MYFAWVIVHKKMFCLGEYGKPKQKTIGGKKIFCIFVYALYKTESIRYYQNAHFYAIYLCLACNYVSCNVGGPEYAVSQTGGNI